MIGLTNKGKLILLEKILIQSGIPRRDFSLSGYSDDRVCLEYNENEWIIYMCERGNKLDVFKSGNFECVIKNFVDRLVETEEETKAIVGKYFIELERVSIRRNSKTTGTFKINEKLAIPPRVAARKKQDTVMFRTPSSKQRHKEKSIDETNSRYVEKNKSYKSGRTDRRRKASY